MLLKSCASRNLEKVKIHAFGSVIRVDKGRMSELCVGLSRLSARACLECRIENECRESTCNSSILAKLLAMIIIKYSCALTKTLLLGYSAESKIFLKNENEHRSDASHQSF